MRDSERQCGRLTHRPHRVWGALSDSADRRRSHPWMRWRGDIREGERRYNSEKKGEERRSKGRKRKERGGKEKKGEERKRKGRQVDDGSVREIGGGWKGLGSSSERS